MISIGNAAVSDQELLKIYRKLILVDNIKNVPKLYIDDMEMPNGWYRKSDHSITITASLLEVGSKDTIATTLGHELIHAKYRDEEVSDSLSKIHEKRADIEGKSLTEKAGYNVCKGFKWIYDGKHISPDHPHYLERWKYLGCQK